MSNIELPAIQRVQASLLTFRFRRACCHSNPTRAPTASAQYCTTRGTPYHSPKLHPGPYSSIGMWRGIDRGIDTQTLTETYRRLLSNTFRLAMPNAKCNNDTTILMLLLLSGIGRNAARPMWRGA